MRIARIKLAYRQMIDTSGVSLFERDVFNDSYQEFLMQMQAYNPGNRFRTFGEIVANNPKANSLHYKVGFSVGLYVDGLQNEIPGQMDSLQRFRLAFESYEFRIVDSDIYNRASHKVSISFTTPEFELLAIVGDWLVLAIPETKDGSVEGGSSFMVKPGAELGVVSYVQETSVINRPASKELIFHADFRRSKQITQIICENLPRSARSAWTLSYSFRIEKIGTGG